MARKSTVAAVAALLFVGLFSSTPVTASCNTSSRGNQSGNFWDVNVNNPPFTTVWSAVTDSWFYSYPYQVAGGTTNWVMLERSDGSQWAQVGWEYRASDGTHWTFWQWTQGGHVYTGRAQPNGVNGYDYYRVDWNTPPYPNKFTFTVDSTVEATPSADWTPNGAQYGSEVTNIGNQMPGGVQSKEQDIYSQMFYSGSWHDFGGWEVNSATNWYGYLNPDGQTLTTWDTWCTQ
jgi:hypothetical protein